MTCICEDIEHCYIEEFILERASCLPEQAINYHEVKEASKVKYEEPNDNKAI